MAVSSKKKSSAKVKSMGTSCSKNVMGKEIDVIVVGGPKKATAKKITTSKAKPAVKTVKVSAKTATKTAPKVSSKESAVVKKAKGLFEDLKEMNINTEEKVKRFFKLHFGGEEESSVDKKKKGGIMKSVENFFGSLFEGDKKLAAKKAAAKKTTTKKTAPSKKK